MIERFANTPDELENARRRITELTCVHGEWFYSDGKGSDHVALTRGEFDFRITGGRLIFTCWGEKGTLAWRVTGWEWASDKLLLEATRRTGAERAMLELIPRAAASTISAVVSAARLENCKRLALLACAQARGAKVERASLSPGVRRGQPGRYARILLRLPFERIAVTGAVDAAREHDVDAFLSSALIWFLRKVENARAPDIKKLWLAAEKRCVEAATERLALLRDDLRSRITLYEIDNAWQELTLVPQLERTELWTKRRARLPKPLTETVISEQGARIVALAPQAIDVVRARHGETLRFHGLPFARIRRVTGSCRVWFGINDGRWRRRLLEESTEQELTNLLDDLKEHRRAETDDRQHALYRAAPEAWLESLLRRDITRLDPGLRLAPLHAQFRASSAGTGRGTRHVDLLALRQDGRLVVIELKVSEDREHVLQGADYWRQVEAHRRQGHITRARLFGDAVIRDEPPLVYLVAPTLSFHRTFNTLAQAIDPAIEIYRFDINEDWRAGVRVMRRCARGHVARNAI